MTVRHQAEQLAAEGRAVEAHAMLAASVASGDADAAFTLGVWKATGQHLPRDLAAARDLFAAAAKGGVEQAAIIHTNFLASGVGGAPDWAEAIDQLRARVRTDSRAERQLAIVEGMAIDSRGDPLSLPQAEVLSEDPDVRMFAGLFTQAECAYLTEAAGPLLKPSLVVDNDSGRQVPNPIRTSDGALFTWPLQNPAIHALNRRIAAASGTDVAQGEPLQVLRYRPGQEYRTHIDAIPGLDNQRAMTMLVYLNDDYDGGETRFVHCDLALRGGIGDGLLFRNIDAEGRPDKNAAHAGLPVTRGVKMIASRWIRAQPFEA